MPVLRLRHFVGLLALLVLTASAASAQLEPPCVENSPEREGGIGCSIVEIKPLTGILKEPLVWHIDRLTPESVRERLLVLRASRFRRTERGGSWRSSRRATIITAASM